MDENVEALCTDEVEHLLLDADKKIDVAFISNNWNISFMESESILQKWLAGYKGDKKILKDYLIRGVDLNGNCVITVVPEKKLNRVERLCPKFTKTLYSIEVETANDRRLNITEKPTNKYITLRLQSEKRDNKDGQKSHSVAPATAPVAKSAAPVAKPKVEVKTELKSESAPSTKHDEVKVKKTLSPKKESPRKSQAAAKNVKSTTGKSISLFFSAKPSSSTQIANKLVSEATAEIEKVEIKEEPMGISNSTKITNKRPHAKLSDSSDESNKKTKPESKKLAPEKKKLKLQPTARSRLMKICDSSSDEEDVKPPVEEIEAETIEVKKEKENKTPSPEKNGSGQGQANDSSGSTGGKKRVKVKKMVTKTYEDEEGFINTVRELEEVSCSEEEAEIVVPPKKPVKVAESAESATSTTNKKKVSPPAGKKQGSILSFFSKK